MSTCKLAFACTLILGTLCLNAHAADLKKPPAHKAAVAAKQAEPDEDEPETTGSLVTEFSCELGNRVTIFSNAEDEAHIALRWKKRLHRLTRVGTTTGALRFENVRYGLIWIGIPAKGMLLDSKQNRQLANECKNLEQRKTAAAPAAPVHTGA